MEVGIIGSTGSGKTTLFTAITGIEPAGEIGKRAVVKVPDERLDRLTEAFNPKKKVNATINFIDAPPPSSLSTKRGGQTQGFLNFVKTVDAFLIVAPVFRADGTKEVQDLMEILQLSDIELLEGVIEREKKIKIDPHYSGPSVELARKLVDGLTNGKFIRNVEMTETERDSLRGMQLFTAFPTFVTLNIAESELGKDASEETKKTSAYLASIGIPSLAVCATVEAQISTLDEVDRQAFMEEYGIKDPVSHRVIREVFNLLGNQTFFTVGEDECRAWTIRRGDNAVTAAGKVHSDIARGFIRAECCTYEDLRECEYSLKEAKVHAKLRLEGKDYTIRDGEIVHFRHSG